MTFYLSAPVLEREDQYSPEDKYRYDGLEACSCDEAEEGADCCLEGVTC